LGVPVAEVDPNQLSTRWAHDGFGRITREVRADGTETTTTLTRIKNGGPLANEWNIRVTTLADGGRYDKVQLDALGRAVRAWTYGPHLGPPPYEPIVQELAFDDRGEHLARRSVPTGEATPP